MFSAALASGQLGPLMSQFGLPAEAVDAANKGGKCLAVELELLHSYLGKLCRVLLACLLDLKGPEKWGNRIKSQVPHSAGGAGTSEFLEFENTE